MKPIIHHPHKTITQICFLGLILCTVLLFGCKGRQRSSSSLSVAAAVVPAQAAVAPVPTLAPPPMFSSPSELGVIEVRVEAEVVPSAAQPAEQPRRRGIFRGRSLTFTQAAKHLNKAASLP